MNNKAEHRQNLVPFQLRVKYIYDRTVIPLLMMVIIATLIVGGVTYGKSALVTIIGDRIEISKSSSEKTMYEKRVSERNTLTNQLRTLQDGGVPFDGSTRYDVKSLIDYLIKNKTNGISLILIEDDRVTNGTVSEPEGPADTGEEDGDGDVEKTEEPPESSGGASNSLALAYTGDIGKSKVNLRGFATSQSELSSYMKTLSDLRIISSYEIKAVESVKIYNYSIWLFDVALTPYVDNIIDDYSHIDPGMDPYM